jgi:hypothetical protein
MKVIEIVPRRSARLYDALVAKEAAIRKNGRGTYSRVGRATRRGTQWKHKMYRGTVRLARDRSEVVTAKVRATTPEDERRLLSSFLGFVDRHSQNQVDPSPSTIDRPSTLWRAAKSSHAPHRGWRETVLPDSHLALPCKTPQAGPK